MVFKQCSGCKGYYNAAKGGCVNPGCAACDRALVSRLNTAPSVPKVKPRRAPPPVPARNKTSPVAVVPHGGKPVAPRNPQALAGLGSPPKESGPLPVVAPESEDLQHYVEEQGEGNCYVVYRGDSRTPAQLRTYGGFTAWVPLSLQQAREVVRRSYGENFELHLPKAAARLEAAFNRSLNLNLLTLGRQIKLEKAGDTFHISTDPTEDCGGYASGYIYAMRFKTLFLVDKAGQVSSGPLAAVRGINPKLVLDKHGYTEAGTIAVAIPGQGGAEVAFLTSIPMANIFKYRMPGSRTWHRLPG